MSLIIFLYIGCVILPVLFWFCILRKIDENEPEPMKSLILVFFLGIGATFLTAFVYEFIMPFTDTLLLFNGTSMVSVFLAGPFEESIKLFLLFEVIYFSKEFTQVRDGIIYAVVLALGFSFLENTTYFINTLASGTNVDLLVVGVMRAIVSTLIHVCAAIICGWYVGKAKFSADNRKQPIFIGLLLAAFLHGMSNLLLVVVGVYGLITVFVLTLGISIFIIRRVNKQERKVLISV